MGSGSSKQEELILSKSIQNIDNAIKAMTFIENSKKDLDNLKKILTDTMEQLKKKSIGDSTKDATEKVSTEKVPIEKVATTEKVPTEKVPIEKVPTEKVPTEKVEGGKLSKKHKFKRKNTRKK